MNTLTIILLITLTIAIAIAFYGIYEISKFSKQTLNNLDMNRWGC